MRIHNVSVENLEPDPFYLNSEINPAAILAVSLRNVTISNCTIRNNQVTGIFLLATTALLQDNIILTNNSGVNGGGMALISNSFVVLDASTHLQFSNNSTAKFGGGVYVSQDIIGFMDGNPLSYAEAYCFASSISENDVQPRLEFTGNKANASGQIVYGAYLSACSPILFNGEHTSPVYPSAYDDLYTSVCSQTVISSDPLRLVLCNGHCVNTNGRATTKIPPLYPGQVFNFTVAAIGEL